MGEIIPSESLSLVTYTQELMACILRRRRREKKAILERTEPERKAR